MKRVSILVPETAVIEAVADPHYMFNMVNQFLQSTGGEPLFEVQLVGVSKSMQLGGSLFTVNTDKLLSEVDETDLVVIPAISGDIGNALSQNEALLPWITKQYEQGAAIASLCLGAFILAATGLLNGKKCSTHWFAANEFRERFPDVELVDGSIITAESGLYSSGGANSYWKLLLYLVEKYTDRATAILASKYFAVDIDRESQSAFMIFEGQKNHQDQEILQAQAFIEGHFQDKLMVDELATRFNMGRRTFERRFRQATHHSVLDYIQRVKMEAAKQSFENSRNNINDVMYQVGYTDTKAFRTIFKKVTGLSPLAYRNKYSKFDTAYA